MEAGSYVYVFKDYDDLPNVTNFTDTPLVLDLDTLNCKPSAVLSAAMATLGAIHILNFLLAVPGNLLVGLVVGLNRRGLTPSDVYLFHLALADGLLALTLPCWATASLQGWLLGSFLCKLLSLVMEANFYTSILFLTCISVDRYLVIVHATDPRSESRRWPCSRTVCGAVWTMGVALAMPALFNQAFVARGDPTGWMWCAEQHDDPGSATRWRLATRTLQHVLGFLAPLVVMAACYGVTVARLLRTRGFRKHRAMRVIVAVVTAFLLCWAPYHLALISDTLMEADLVEFSCQTRTGVDLALRLTRGLALTHCCINPVLYAFIGEKFRRNLAQLLRRSRRLRGSHGSGSRFSRSTSQTSEGNGMLV